MTYKEVIKIPKKEVEELQRLLDLEEVDFEEEDVEEDSVLLEEAVIFDNDFKVLISVCSGQNNLYVSSSLFDPEGYEVCIGEVSFELLGEYRFEYNGDEYVVYVEEE